MIIGYAPNNELSDQAEQNFRLGRLGAEKVVVGRPARPVLGQLMDDVGPGDTLVVTSLSSLAASLPELREVLVKLAAKAINLQVGDRRFDLQRPDQLLTDAIDLMAGFERELAAQRDELERRAARTARGRRPGRKPKLSPAQERNIVGQYRQGISSVEELAEEFGIGSSTIYRVLDRAADLEENDNRHL